MSDLRENQARFMTMLGQLLAYVETLDGYRVRGDWLYRSPQANNLAGGIADSLHTQRLAIDLVLDKRNAAGVWVWQQRSEDYEPLGVFWESIGGTWGGRFKPVPDGVHFSLAYGGRK